MYIIFNTAILYDMIVMSLWKIGKSFVLYRESTTFRPVLIPSIIVKTILIGLLKRRPHNLNCDLFMLFN